MSRRARTVSTEVEGSTLTCHDIYYTVQVKNPKKICRTMPKEILKGINGIYKPGMNAIMGPTGGGKSSLLDVLAGRKDPIGLSGTVLIDGHQQPKNFKCISGYVVQDDVVMGTLTVRENLMFSANVRLAKTVSKKEKERRVQDVINELGLTSCAETKVGNELIRGVSGGERKRTNVGMELIIAPSVLFLDEPTTGLDSNTANSTMRLLHSISRRGRTVIFSIHQPRYAIYKLFDHLTLLGRGRTVFHGPASAALGYFSSMGYECEAHNNPADFFLDVINDDYVEPGAAINDESGVQQDGHTDEAASPVPTDGDMDSVAVVKDGDIMVVEIKDGEPTKPDKVGKETDKTVTHPSSKMEDHFEESHWHEQLKSSIDPIYKTYEATVSQSVDSVEEPVYASSFATQTLHLSVRSLKNIYRDPASSLLQWSTFVAFALVVGIIYFDLDSTYPEGIQNRAGAFFFVIMNLIFSNLSALELFINERALFVHENVSGFYRVSAYFVSKVFCDIIPMRVVPIIPFSVITYFMMGLDRDVAKFFTYMLTCLLTSLSASSVAFFFGATFRVFALGNLAMALSYVFMMVFAGLFINVGSIARWLRWFQYLSIFRYSLKAMAITEMKDKDFSMEITDANGTKSTLWLPAGNEYLEQQRMEYDTDWDLWLNEFALFMLFVAFLILTYVQLRAIKKLK